MDGSDHPDVAAISRIAFVPKLLEVVTRLTGLRFAAVARVTDTQWITCAVRDEIDFGLVPGSELPLETTICNEIRDHRRPVVFEHASAHPVYANHHTPLRYGLESYISVPLYAVNGEFFGTLCAIDPEPSSVEARGMVDMLELLAQLIGSELESVDRLRLSQSALRSALDVAGAREQFIGEVSDGLRDPLQAVVMDAHALRTSRGLGEEAMALARSIELSAWRMADVIEELASFNHDQIDGGAELTAVGAAALTSEITRMLTRLAAQNPGRPIATLCRIDGTVDCAPRPLAQLLANLVVNVLRHSDAESTVSVEIGTAGEHLRMDVSATGLSLPDNVLDSVSGTLVRPAGVGRQDAWNFFTAGEIARAHGGWLAAELESPGGRLSFTMPVRQAA